MVTKLEGPEYMTVKEAMQTLGVSRAYIYRLIKAGTLDARPFNPLYGKGGPVRLLRVQVEALIPKS